MYITWCLFFSYAIYFVKDIREIDRQLLARFLRLWYWTRLMCAIVFYCATDDCDLFCFDAPDDPGDISIPRRLYTYTNRDRDNMII
jgi:hypothetical protein